MAQLLRKLFESGRERQPLILFYQRPRVQVAAPGEVGQSLPVIEAHQLLQNLLSRGIFGQQRIVHLFGLPELSQARADLSQLHAAAIVFPGQVGPPAIAPDVLLLSKEWTTREVR